MNAGPVLAVRLDSAGDVLLTGPAVRALSASGRGVVYLAGPLGEAAANLLPGVDRVLTWACPWILADPPAAEPADMAGLIDAVTASGCDEAVIFTSFHQSPLPTALVLRLAGISRISAISIDYPGSLLDRRVEDPGDVPEPERALHLTRAAGFGLPDDDSGRLAVTAGPAVETLVPNEPYVVLHPGTSAPARAWPVDRWRDAVAAVRDAGWSVVVTGSPTERELCERIVHGPALNLAGRTTLAELGSVLRSSSAVVVANTGPAHLAAAVGAPIVSLFAPTVSLKRWAPYGVDRVVLGDQEAPCKATRALHCPVPGHPCLSHVTPEDVVAAIDGLVSSAGTSHVVMEVGR